MVLVVQGASSPIPLKVPSNGKKKEASDCSNFHFDKSPPFLNIIDVNMNGEMFNNVTESCPVAASLKEKKKRERFHGSDFIYSREKPLISYISHDNV